MTDAQAIFDSTRRQFNEIADSVERHFEDVAGQLRQWISTDGSSLGSINMPKRLPPPTMMQVARKWVAQHRSLTAAMIAFFVTGSVGALVYVKSKDSKRKRRAKKSVSGARTEVVLVAGAVANPITSSLYLDLERRGYVVYVIASTKEEESYIRSQSRADLLSVRVDLVDPFQAQEQFARFTDLLERNHYAFDGASPHRLHLAGMILVPDTQSAPASVQSISSEEWSDALNAKVLNTIATTQLFLPAMIDQKAKIILLTPSVRPALTPPLHAIESSVYGALEGFISCLAKEVQDQGVQISHYKLGNIDIPSVTAKRRREGELAPRLKATPLRRLQDSVFDTLVAKHPSRTVHIGRGSLAYAIIGSWIPDTVTGWMMGVGRKSSQRSPSPREDLHASQGSLTWEKIEQEV